MPTIVKPSPLGKRSITALAFAMLEADRKKAKPEPAEEPPPKKKKAKPADKTQLSVPKEQPSQHGTYMAVVRRLNCRRCGAPPPGPKKGNEFCHRDEGKGKGLKTDVREGWAGCAPCHRLVGSTGQLPKEERRAFELEAGASTRAEVMAKGLWPRSLPPYQEKKK